MAFQPMPLSRRALPFDHPEWIFELKYDGFRALAVIENGRTQLISRNGHPFNSFSELSKSLTHSAGKTVLDGEIVCLDKQGLGTFSRSAKEACDDGRCTSPPCPGTLQCPTCVRAGDKGSHFGRFRPEPVVHPREPPVDGDAVRTLQQF